MAMNYTKITVALFSERLKDNLYKNITAARRAVGKADWSADERQKAHILADRHFNIGKGPSKAPTVTKQTAPRVIVKAKPAPARSEPAPALARKPPAVASIRSVVGTNAEILEICGMANNIVETIRKSAEVTSEIKDTLTQANKKLLECFNVVYAALKAIAGPGAEALRTSERAGRGRMGNKISPTTHIARSSEDQATAANG